MLRPPLPVARWPHFPPTASVTRASLLHVLDPGAALGPQQVRELEELAQAFPYCQTAHLLLAKAAHDQGTMLAGQRLRRAATYAADRALLRRLIETTPPVPTEAVPAAAVVMPAPAVPEPAAVKPGRFVVQRSVVGIAPAPVADIPLEPSVKDAVATVTDFLVDEPDEIPVKPLFLEAPTPHGAVTPGAPTPTATPMPVISRAGVTTATGWSVSTTAASNPGETAAASPPEAPVLAVGLPFPDEVGTIGAASFAAGSAAEKALDAAEPATVSAAAFTSAPGIAAADEPAFAPAPVASTEVETVVFTEPDATFELPTASIAAETAPALAETEAIASLISDPASQAPAAFEPLVEITAPLPTPPALAPVAPPVRPPLDAGAARFEYGLADALDPTPAYLLPGLTDEWTWTLPPKPFVPPGLTPAAFLGDETLGYGWGESSRLGLALMPLSTEEQPDDALSVAFALPLPNTFFAPDALLLAHWAEHRPKALPPPTSLELIETFLRQKPRLTRPAFAKTTAETPTDLAAPSTNAPPELISESLARILARQGKLARAIEVYERLMVKHPEKMAYFATEIQSLQLQQPPLP